MAQKKASEPLKLGIEDGKLPPVAFSHTTHIVKTKIDCAVCHHKDKDRKELQGCLSCHPYKDVKGNALTAEKAFHKMCLTCHREERAKGVTVPTKCNECHQK